MSETEQRFGLTMRGVDRDEPGLVRELDGTVWLVNPDGTRTQLPGNGGSQPVFSGARYSADSMDDIHSPSGIGPLHRVYDVGGYSAVDGSGFSLDDEMRAPADGYYRLTGAVSVAFGGTDATFADCIIASPDRDGDWDVLDHFSVVPGARSSASATVTHWLAAGDRVRLVIARDGSAPHPGGSAALEVVFEGSGVNPAAP